METQFPLHKKAHECKHSGLSVCVFVRKEMLIFLKIVVRDELL